MKKLIFAIVLCALAGCEVSETKMEQAAKACAQQGGKLYSYEDTSYGVEFKCQYQTDR